MRPLSCLVTVAFVFCPTADAKPHFEDGEKGHLLACSFYEFYELEVNGVRFHCPEYSHPYQWEKPWEWPQDTDFDNPFIEGELENLLEDLEPMDLESPIVPEFD